MSTQAEGQLAQRISDLVRHKEAGAAVSCRPAFEILPVDFRHRQNPFKAYIFLCRYSGEIDGAEYSFRKCYARGCPHNLCPQVSQAVMIANRYLERDYAKLDQAGIEVPHELFSLDAMMLQFDKSQQEYSHLIALHDYIELARAGNQISVATSLELVPAVEHFDGQDTKMIFLMAEFEVFYLDETRKYERCLACYPLENESGERQAKIELANERLGLLYDEFKQAGMNIEQAFFQ